MQEQVGPYRMLPRAPGGLGTGGAGRTGDAGGAGDVPWYVMPFDAAGRSKAPATRAHLLETVRRESFTNIFLFSHGWNNDWRAATARYEAFFDEFRRVRAAHSPDAPSAFKPLLIGVFWPSTSLVLPWERAPRFAAAGAAGSAEARRAAVHQFDARADELDQCVDALASEVPAAQRGRFYELVGATSLDAAEVTELATMVAPTLGALDDAVEQQDDPDGTDSAASELAEAWASGARVLEQLESPRTSRDEDDDDDFGVARPDGSADPEADSVAPRPAGLVRSLDPRNVLRMATVWKMKDRAGTVGFHGVGPLLRELLAAAATDGGRGRVHLIGHSYGAKVVMSALASAPVPRPVRSALLLQPAFSHLAFAARVPGANHPGGYRVTLDRIEQPILATFSPHDVALRRTFHLAVRRRADLGEARIAALHNAAPSRFAALGGFGPGGMDETEARITKIPETGASYDPLLAADGKVIGLDGTGVINGHGDIVRAETAWALLAQVLR